MRIANGGFEILQSLRTHLGILVRVANIPVRRADGAVHGQPGIGDGLFRFVHFHSWAVHLDAIKAGFLHRPEFLGERSRHIDHPNFERFVDAALEGVAGFSRKQVWRGEPPQAQRSGGGSGGGEKRTA